MRTSFIQWCKDAGPIGPVLWLFEQIVYLGAETNEPESNSYTGLLIFLGVCVALLAALVIVGP